MAQPANSLLSFVQQSVVWWGLVLRSRSCACSRSSSGSRGDGLVLQMNNHKTGTRRTHRERLPTEATRPTTNLQPPDEQERAARRGGATDHNTGTRRTHREWAAN